MKNTIFYSWQSDLPNNSNRGFLEKCIEDVLKKIESLGSFSIELTIDRGTKDEVGTPNIVNTVFKKIDNAKIFIADISIINSASTTRKTPNPNVLLELGYAVRSLGWEKVICLYNLDYGCIDDLPFDLRQRRPLTYSLIEISKSQVRKKISSIISESIFKLNSSGALFDIINDYLKVQVDTEILTCINHFKKIIFGYFEKNSLKQVNDFLNLQESQIKEILSERKFIGFQIFKKLEINESNLQKLADKAISSSFHGKEIAAVIIELVRWIGRFDNFNRYRTSPDLFIPLNIENQDYKVLSSEAFSTKNNEFPDRYILLKKLDDEHGKVQDFGDFIERDKIDGLLSMYTLNPKYIDSYMNMLTDFIKISERWLDLTNGEFIIENTKMFEIKRDKKIGHSI